MKGPRDDGRLVEGFGCRNARVEQQHSTGSSERRHEILRPQVFEDEHGSGVAGLEHVRDVLVIVVVDVIAVGNHGQFCPTAFFHVGGLEVDDVAVGGLRDELQIRNRYLTAINQIRELGEDLAAALIPGPSQAVTDAGSAGIFASSDSNTPAARPLHHA